MRYVNRRVWVTATFAAVLALAGACNHSEETDTKGSERPPVSTELPACEPEATVLPGEDGVRRLALLVGVGEYLSDAVADLKGPPRDVKSVYRLLTDPAGGYGFPAQNVCVLIDADATLALVVAYFEKALIARARPGDVVFFYFAGHGSQMPDDDGDEPDGRDETLVLHDSRTSSVGDLLDDELSRLLHELHSKTNRVVVALDAGNSGNATDSDDNVVARLTPPGVGASGTLMSEGRFAIMDRVPQDLPGVTVLLAADERAPAMESRQGDGGFFTQALIQVLGSLGSTPVTWHHVSRRVPSAVSALSGNRQNPIFHGDRDRVVFDARNRSIPLGWKVLDVAGDTISLGGVPLPGWGPGSLLRIYARDARGAEARDPANAKATVEITNYDGVTASASVLEQPDAAIATGDLATLVLPGVDAATLLVRLTTGSTAEALDSEQIEQIEGALASNAAVSALISLTDTAGGFSVGVDHDNRFRIRGPEGRIRHDESFENADKVVESLGLHARQRALLYLEGEGGLELVNDQSLMLRLVPTRTPTSECAARALSKWVQGCPNEEQIIPLCAEWQLEVTNDSTVDLVIGGAILGNDGAMLGLPDDGIDVPLAPGESHKFPVLAGLPPLDATEHVVIFGTKESMPIDWSLLTTPAVAARASRHPLEQAIQTYLAGSRGVSFLDDALEPWTSSKLTFRVLANAQFAAVTDHFRACDSSAVREYTVRDFDIRPYLPANDNALRRVLEQGYYLAGKANADASGDGLPYKQHPWNKGSGNARIEDDDANLAEGIDCSRTMWWLFTRSDLEYNSRNWHGGYLSTAEMFDRSQGSCLPEITPARTLMHEQFESCLGEPFQTGDVLVYQGRRPATDQCVGHTIMVIDPGAFIGHGSHGWDGSTDEEDERLNDVGVEYQEIMKRTWVKWDRREFKLKGCWRHRRFIEEANVAGGRPGDAPLADPCGVACQL